MGLKKDIFKMKLSGDWQTLMEYAFIRGYHRGVENGQDDGCFTLTTYEKEFKKFMIDLDNDISKSSK